MATVLVQLNGAHCVVCGDGGRKKKEVYSRTQVPFLIRCVGYLFRID